MLVDVEQNSLEVTFALIKQLLASICAMVHPGGRAGQVLQPCCHLHLIDFAAGQQQMYMTMRMTITAARGRSSPPQACTDESHGRMRL